LKRLRPAAHAPEVGRLASYGIKLSEGWAMLAALTDKMLNTGAATDEVRAGDQSQSSACYRHRHPAGSPRPRR
jgi:hypothetical protein